MMIVRLRLTSEEGEEKKEAKKTEQIDSDCHTVVLTTDQLQSTQANTIDKRKIYTLTKFLPFFFLLFFSFSLVQEKKRISRQEEKKKEEKKKGTSDID
jgi:NADH dehydrogenase/NADH:ubiquinone oxidoreductase subunit G